ncbi:MAG: 50S ribosomal protein L19e [Nanoarchaeota archaeon]
MNLRNRKMLVARMEGVGVDRVRFDPDSLDQVSEAITKRDFKSLLSKGIITIKQKIGTSTVRHKKQLIQKRKGRRAGKGSKKGKRTARLPKKDAWKYKVRSQRSLLKKLKDAGMIEKRDFREMYKKAKGNVFRSKRHLKAVLEEQTMIKEHGNIQKKKTRKN